MESSLFAYINLNFIEGINDELNQRLQPISGYAKEPLIPLEDACEPLKDIVPRLDAHISVAKHSSQNPADGLTQDESAAIRLYTMEWDDRDSKTHDSLYLHLNRTLKQVDRTKLRPWFRYLKLLLTALAKLPPLPKQTVWCGVRRDISADYPPGEELIWWTFSSSTATLDVLNSKFHLDSFGQRTLFSIEVCNGRAIRAHSYPKFEDEILLLPGTCFEVKARVNPASDLHIIYLQQKIPSHDLLEPPFEGAQNFSLIEQNHFKNLGLHPSINHHKKPWYKKKTCYIVTALSAWIILLTALLTILLGSRNNHKELSTLMITDSINNYNVSVYPPVSVATAFYSFDRNAFDLYRSHDGTITGGPVNYIDGYIGYGQAILINQTNITSIFVPNPFDLSDTSFTVELFIYFYESQMYANLVQFSSTTQLNIQDGSIGIVFAGNDVVVRYYLTPNKWYHIAAVYNLAQSTITLFIDGRVLYMVAYLSLPPSFFYEDVTMTIGSRYTGVIDQLSISLEAKTDDRILWDATTAAFYPFEGQTNGMTLDFGPNGLNATVSGVQTVLGQVRNAINFNLPKAYVQAPGFTVLNIPQHEFSVALWIRPSMNSGIFLTIANSVSCLLVLGLRSSDNHLVAYLPNSTSTNSGASLVGSELIMDRWTHIAFTWSNDHQAQLYQDTTLQGSNKNATKLNNGYGTPMTITLGMYRDSVSCDGGDGLNSTNQFTGSIDEFYVFSRELTQYEIQKLNATTN